MMVLLLSVISKLIIPLWFFCYVLSDICRWAGWKCHVLVREKQFKEMHWFSQKKFIWKRFGSRKKGKRGGKKKKKSFIQNEISESIAFGEWAEREPTTKPQKLLQNGSIACWIIFSVSQTENVRSYLKKEPRFSHLKVHTLCCFLLSIVTAHLY